MSSGDRKQDAAVSIFLMGGIFLNLNDGNRFVLVLRLPQGDAVLLHHHHLGVRGGPGGHHRASPD